MRKIVCFLCLIITSAWILHSPSVFAWTDSLASIRKTADRVKSISASFVQEKHLAMLKKPLISKGLLLYQKPDALRWEYRSPIISVLISYQGETKRFFKREQTFVSDAGSQLQVMQIVLNEITNWLGGRFNEGGNFIATLGENGVVLLQPASPQMTKMIGSIELALSRQPGLIDTVTIHESKHSFTKLIFHNIRLNETIDPFHFQNP